MFRFLGVVGKNISVPRALVFRLAQEPKMSTSLLCRSSNRKPRSDGFKITDINIYDMAKRDKEFARNFLTSPSMLNKGSIENPISTSLPKPDVAEPSVSSPGGSAPTSGTVNSSGSVLDVNGNQVVPIEIDGWNQDYEDADPTVQKPNTVDIGNDDEYKQEMSLTVPETREGQYEYKGIKITLPKKASKDVGTYRFRRDDTDLKTVADDIRVVKYDKK